MPQAWTKSDGYADVYTDLWIPNRAAIWDEFIDGAKTLGHNAPYAGTQRLYVQAFMTDPEVAAMFDKDGNGKGEY